MLKEILSWKENRVNTNAKKKSESINHSSKEKCIEKNKNKHCNGSA